ncbi:redoxin domain-containing protein [Singulisphaera sp. PoT]|uniref:redoxin domain-containing protein n=1 Tax=Singulisphaera sp. PoT TaxID=3411797 RepID=UPI003BF5E3D0
MASRIVRGVVGILALATTLGSARGAEAPPLDRGVGQRVSNFTLEDVSGKKISLYGYRGKKAVVVTFIGTDCPVGNLYIPRLVEMNKEYKDRGVVFLAINANAHETMEQVVAHAKERGIDFPVLKDPNNLVADQLLAERTCESLVIDGKAILRYRGAIDDQYGQGTRKPDPTRNFVREALEEVLAGKPVTTASTPVVGCLFDRAETASANLAKSRRVRGASPEILAAIKEQGEVAPAKVGKVTYASDVAAILQAKCQSCHRPGEVGPFPLLSYDDARGHAAMIREVVDERRMPPWHADPRYGHFQNDRRLSPEERAKLIAWVEQDSPLGDPAAIPVARTFSEGWTIGKPDAVFEIPEPYTVAAQGVIDYVNIRVPTHFTEDKWIQAAEARPGDRGVVHHIIVYVDDHTKKSRKSEGHLCGFAPGDLPSVYENGTAKKIPAGSDLIFQLHYTPNGKITTDRSKLGVIFAKEPVQHEAHTRPIAQGKFAIPPGADNYEVNSTLTVDRDIRLLNFMPHMHLRGKSFEYKATYPDGRSEILLSVPAYDFAWQSVYVLAKPLTLPKGTRIDCQAHFDNSEGNPNNPDPKKTVTWGDQTFEEMMIGYIDYVDEEAIASKTPESKPADSTSSSD